MTEIKLFILMFLASVLITLAFTFLPVFQAMIAAVLISLVYAWACEFVDFPKLVEKGLDS